MGNNLGEILVIVFVPYKTEQGVFEKEIHE